jgi:hypothetical protein
MNRYHFAYLSEVPDGNLNTFEHLFLLLDEMDLFERDELLERAYLSCGVPFSEEGTRQEQVLGRYKSFVAHCFRKTLFPALASATSRLEEEVQVFAIVSYLLVTAYWKAHVSGLESLISQNRIAIETAQADLRREETAASWSIERIKQATEAIGHLYREVEVRRAAYRTFVRKSSSTFFRSSMTAISTAAMLAVFATVFASGQRDGSGDRFTS